MKEYDIIVIGAGSGGLNIAGFMNKAGFKVLLIDKSDPSIGGDCLNFGCVPSKALIHVAKLAYHSREVGRFGLKSSGSIDIKKVMKYIKDKQNVIREHENASYFRKIGMDVALGKAKFVSRKVVSVDGKEYTAKKIVVATGSRPRQLKLPGIEKIKYYTNENIFDINFLPKKLLVIGGGPIGIELSQAFSRLGSKVTVVEKGPKFLPKENSEIAEILCSQLKKEGIEFYFNTTMVEFSSLSELVVKRNGKKEKISFDAVLISIGRQLNLEGLNLKEAGIEYDDRKIRVDEYLRTTNKDVILCGDIAGSFQFTHAAELHAGVIINNFFSPFKKKLNNDYLSWVTYTDPQIATFGVSEAVLKERGVSFEKLELNFNDDDRAIVDEVTFGKSIIYISKDMILGGTMVGENAGEIFQELVLANSTGLKIGDMFKKIYPYPTQSRVNKLIISKHMAKKLTPRAKKIFRWLY